MIQVKERITQGMLEQFEAGLREEKQKGIAETRGAIARAAMAAGWLEPVEDINELDPREVGQIAEQVAELYTELLMLSPHDQGGGESRPEQEESAAA